MNEDALVLRSEGHSDGIRQRAGALEDLSRAAD
jgi:hypothetical protein